MVDTSGCVAPAGANSPNVDDGLTSLTWLQNLNMCMTRLGAPTPPTPPASPSQQNHHPQQQFLTKRPSSSSSPSYHHTSPTMPHSNGQYYNQRQNHSMRYMRTNAFNEYEPNPMIIQMESISPIPSSVALPVPMALEVKKQKRSRKKASQRTASVVVVTPSDQVPRVIEEEELEIAMVEEEEIAVEAIDYLTDGSVKPPFSYATLICMAMKANKNKMTLNSIYKWIRENFIYYQKADPSWQVRKCLQMYKKITKATVIS